MEDKDRFFGSLDLPVPSSSSLTHKQNDQNESVPAPFEFVLVPEHVSTPVT